MDVCVGVCVAVSDLPQRGGGRHSRLGGEGDWAMSAGAGPWKDTQNERTIG